MTKITLGAEVRDKVTGFKGIVIGHAEFLTGCDQYTVQPKANKSGSKFEDGRWFDEGRLEKVGEGIHEEEVKAEKDGCDTPAPDKTPKV